MVETGLKEHVLFNDKKKFCVFFVVGPFIYGLPQLNLTLREGKLGMTGRWLTSNSLWLIWLIYMLFITWSLREKCPYSKLFWSAFSRIRTEYGEILRISPYSVRMRGNTDQNNFEYRHFLRSGYFKVFTFENEMWWRFIWNNLSEFVSWNRLVESMLDLYYFVMWLVVCLLFVKLFTWDFVFIVYIGFDWRYVEKVTRKIKKREIDNV